MTRQLPPDEFKPKEDERVTYLNDNPAAEEVIPTASTEQSKPVDRDSPKHGTGTGWTS